MKAFKNAIKDILILIAYIGPLILILLDDFNIAFKIIIAGITFLCNAIYRHRTSNLKEEFSELKNKYKNDIQRYEKWDKNNEEYLSFYKNKLDEAYTKIDKLNQEIETYKKAGKP